VLGAHPHVLQPVRIYRGALIAYSLGNFVFSSGSPRSLTSMILRVGVLPDGSVIAARIPIRIAGGIPAPA
jgi:poly-gamma-glutamate synthesis protein (capsule biosynthesis protein)